jgi:hypothetical protein
LRSRLSESGAPSGSNLRGATATFGGVAAVIASNDLDDQLIVVTPEVGTAGTVDVVITTFGGTVTLEDAFTYED